MFDFWCELPPLLRACCALALMGVAVFIFFATGGRRAAVGLFATGFVLLLFAGAGSNNNGYRF